MHADVPNHEPSLLLMNCGEARLVAAERGLVAHLRPGHARTRTCPASSPCAPAAIRSRSRRTGRPASCPASIRARTSTRQHTEIEKLIEHIRNHSASPGEQRRQLDLLQQLNRAAPSAARRRRRSSRPASSRSSWPTACRWRRPTPSTSAASREHIREMYGPGVQARQILIARRLRRAGRAVRPGLARRGAALGQPRRPRSEPSPAGQRVRPGDRRAADGPQAARPAGRHAGHLGRRVRPHADGRAADAGLERRARSTAATTTTTASRCGWPAAA